VKDLMAKIKDLEAQIAAVEGKGKAAKPSEGKKK
jgi:hypothetical protein